MASSPPRPRRTPFANLSNLPSKPLPPSSPKKFALHPQIHHPSPLAAAAAARPDDFAPPSPPLAPADETPSRPTNAKELDSSFSTPPCTSSQDLFSGEGDVQIYTRRKASGGSYLTMSCPPFDRNRPASVLNDHQIKSRPSKRSYDFTLLEETSQAKCKKNRIRRRRRSLPSLQNQHWLPEDFINTQRSYFAEVDAFLLSEEEAGSEEE